MNFQKYYQDFDLSLKLITEIQKIFIAKTDFTPFVALELEFFLENAKNFKKSEEFLQSLITIAKNYSIQINNAEIETGEGQFEVSLKYSDNIIKLCSDLHKLKDIISHLALSYKLKANFSAKPLQNSDVGNGLHIHISLWQKNINLYQKKENQFSDLLLESIAGLLEFLPNSMPFFTICDDDFLRFHECFNIDQDNIRHKSFYNFAPTNVSWGVNNRTTALRIPNNNQEQEKNRIEHRVPSSNCNPALAISAILLSILYGIENNLTPPDRVWGNAFDKQYQLDSLPLNYEEGLNKFNNSNLVLMLEKIIEK